MSLNILKVKDLRECFEDIERIVITPDLKLLSIYKKDNSLSITDIRTSVCDSLLLLDVKSFAWLEDNYHENKYQLLIVDIKNEITHCDIKILKLGSATSIVVHSVASWKLKTIFQYFQELSKATENVTSIDILKFEAKEAVFLLDKKIVVSLFPNATEPQVLSFTNISEENISYRKVFLRKEILFALSDDGSKLSIYSFTNNVKLCDLIFSENGMKSKTPGGVINFCVSSKMNKILLITEDHEMFTMSVVLEEASLQVNKEKLSCAESSIITAFSKQYPSVKRIDDGLRRYSVTSGPIQPINFCIDSEFTLQDVYLFENKLCFLLHTVDCSILGVHMLDADSQISLTKSSLATFFIHSVSEEKPFPLLLLWESKLCLMLHEIDQDKLINELMVYPSGGAVEILAALNNWMNIQMDIEVLKLGLRNRQLYTVEFYLKTLLEEFSQQWKHPCSQKWIEKVQSDCLLWEKIMSLLLDTTCKYLTDLSSCQFAEQLLQVSISIVIQVLFVVGSKNVEKESVVVLDEKEKILLLFSNLLQKMRNLLHKQTCSNIKDSEDQIDVIFTPNSYYNAEILSFWSELENLKSEEIMRRTILNGDIPTAQAFFYYNEKDDAKGSYKEFESACLDLVMDCLRQASMPEALTLLSNMGIQIDSKLKEIFFSTSEKDVRAVILTELEKRNLLTDEDVKLLYFVSALEKLHPCTSFDHARQLFDEKCQASRSQVCALPILEETLPVGDYMIFNQDNSESGSYCRVVLDWIRSWDKETRERIIAPHVLQQSPMLDFFKRKESTSIEVSSQSMWLYLLENGDLPTIMKWLNSWLGNNPSEKADRSLEGFTLNEDMINEIADVAPFHVIELALNELARHGVFCEDELEDSSLILQRAGRSSCDINDVSVFTSQVASLSLSELWHRIAHYCLKHQLYKVLYSFIAKNQHWFASWPVCHLCDVSLLKMMKAFCLWSLKLDDCHLAYDAITANAQYAYKLQHVTTEEIVTKIPVPLNVAILLFAKSPLSEVFSQLGNLSTKQMQAATEAFQGFPLLSEFLLKSESQRTCHNVTVYELLKGNSVFDTTLLFGWQRTNTLKSEDSRTEIPHFSLHSLSEQYGLKAELTYLYFLMEGRPHYSFLKFVAQEVLLEAGLSNSRIKSICKEVTDFALSKYRNMQISASCVSFLELLEQDSLALRIFLLSANMMHNNLVQNQDDDADKSIFELGRMLKQAQIKKDTATTLVSALEKITFTKWNSGQVGSNELFASIALWVPVMSLANLCGVESGNSFLLECAKEDKWLDFLVFAEIFQLPKEQVLKSAMKFSDSRITYHLFNALQKPLSSDASAEAKSRKQSTPVRDIRKSWLSHIGVKRGASGAREVSKTSDVIDDEKVSVCSDETSSSSSEMDIATMLPKDLFGLLLLSHKTSAPWNSYKLLQTSIETENPVLALLSTSYTDCDLVSCFFTWLYTNLCHDENIKKQLEVHFPNGDMMPKTEEELEKIILLSVRNHKIEFLWQAVKFFTPDTPLLPLMDFLKKFLVYKKFGSSIESFQNQLWDYSPRQDNFSPLYSLKWIEKVSIRILQEAVIACSNNYQNKILLRHYSFTRLEKSFSEGVLVPPFMKVCQMLQFLDDSEIADVERFLRPASALDYETACWKCVRKLLRAHAYDNAQGFAEAAQLPMEAMLLLHVNHESEEARKEKKWTSLPHRIDFWKTTLQKLMEKNVPVSAVVDFLGTQIEASDKFGEKYFLGKFIIKLLRENAAEAEEVDLEQQERKTWFWCIKAEVDEELTYLHDHAKHCLTFGSLEYLRLNLTLIESLSLEMFDDVPQQTFNICDIYYLPRSPLVAHNFNEREKEAVGNIIRRFLTNKNLQQAFCLANTFGYSCPDAQTIHFCLQLAKEEIDVSFINESMSAVDVPSSRVVRSLVLWATTEYPGFSTLQKETIECMEKICRGTPVAASVCHQILVHYTIAAVLHCPFTEVAGEGDAFATLRRVLSLRLGDDLALAKSLVAVHQLPDRAVAKFFSEEIWRSLKLLAAADMELIPEDVPATEQDILYDPSSKARGFQMVVKIVQDLSLLGRKLMNIYSEESSELTAKPSLSTLTSLVELCICAHECFTAACHVEGISQVLHTAQQLVHVLMESKKFTVVILLLTGIGRYSEMMYVFDILKRHDKFHLLFEGKTEKVHNLRLALLDYLKRCPPSESDGYYYNLTSKLGMYREKAEILEMGAQKQLARLCKRAIDSDLREELEVAMQDLANAARSYCEANCLHQAQMCAQLAQLVALQICLLPSGVWVIGLDEASVARFITEHDTFPQAYIIAQAYNHHQSWNHALVRHAVARGDRDYLRDFQAQLGLSASVVSDVVRKFQQSKSTSEAQLKNLRSFIGLCPNAKVKLQLATELGFADVAAELLLGEDSAYLRDLRANGQVLL